MRKTFLILFLLCIAFASCKKKASTQATYELDGVQDISMQNMVDSSKYLAIQLNHVSGQTQETVTLTISGLPTGINMVTTTGSLTGIPTFSSIVTFYDTTLFGAAPGTYPITISCKGTESGTKTFTFNLIITAAPALVNTNFIGKYNNCTLEIYTSDTTYADSVYIDAVYNNKIWFANFCNTGQKVYASIIACNTNYVLFMIPYQMVNGYTFLGGPEADYTNQTITVGIYYNSMRIIHNSDTTNVEGSFMDR